MNPRQRRPGWHWWRWCGPILSGLLAVLVGFAYGTRPDALAALTVAPVWCWLFLGFLSAVLPWNRRRASVLGAVWLVLSLCFVDELRPLYHPTRWLSAPRRPQTPTDKPRGVVRVISLNCAGGDPEAAAEVAAWLPDIVLLQECPTEPAVRALAWRLYGSEDACVVGRDTAVLARGLEPVALPKELTRYVAAANTPSGLVVSLRLSPTVLRADLWNPECWTVHTADWQARRRALEEAVAVLPKDGPLLIGGDTNAPAGDGIFTVFLENRLDDLWEDAGLGWGNTVANDLPIHRIDQLWSREHTAHGLIAVPTRHSDHRMVVGDLYEREK